MREVWRWSLPLSLLVAGLFITVDGSFVAANMVKFFEGGWIPLVVAAFCSSDDMLEPGLRGNVRGAGSATPFRSNTSSRVPRQAARRGTAVYLSGRVDIVPVPLLHNLKHNKVLHDASCFCVF